MSEQASSESVPQRRLILRAVLRTDVGLVRSENQDFGTYTTASEEERSRTGGRLFIVADGMGGHRGGATASRLAAETVKAQYLGSETSDVPKALQESLIRANARIYSEAQSNPELRGMGTTTSVLAVRGEHGWIAHVGDSRIYRVRNGEIEQLTDDHSLVATMVREGLLTSAEAETHPRRNVLQRSMGVSEEVEVDIVGPIELRMGDTFILCSDGLHGLVKEPELKEIALNQIEVAADEFLRKALERGAPDNVTVIVARVEEGSADETLIPGERLDETQPLDVLDETIRETQKLVAVQPEAPPVSDQLVVAAASVTTSSSEVTAPMASAPQPTAGLEDTSPIALPAGKPTPGIRDTAPIVLPPRVRTEAAATAPVVARKRSILPWMLVLAVILGAIGAWFYWDYQQGHANEAGVTSSR